MLELVTANGKEIAIVNAPGTGHYKMHFTSGGELPESLSGLFTSYKQAEKAAVGYISLSQVKAKNSKEA